MKAGVLLARCYFFDSFTIFLLDELPTRLSSPKNRNIAVIQTHLPISTSYSIRHAYFGIGLHVNQARKSKITEKKGCTGMLRPQIR